jgi:hypothetical protein
LTLDSHVLVSVFPPSFGKGEEEIKDGLKLPLGARGRIFSEEISA